MTEPMPQPRRQPPPPPPPPQKKRGLLLPILLVGLLMLFFGFVVVVLFLFSLPFSDKPAAKVTSGSVLELDLRGGKAEVAFPSPFAFFSPETPVVFHDYVDAVDRAIEDDRIDAILLRVGPGLGWAQAEELRTVLDNFRESGKIIVAHGSMWTEPELFLASSASYVTMMPDSMLMIDGFRARTSFYGDFLDKYGVGVNVAAFGEYKSFGDAYQRNTMSPYAREATTRLLETYERIFIQEVAPARGMEAAQLKTLLDEAIYDSREGIETGLLDAELYEDQLRSYLAKELSLDSADKLNLISVAGYRRSQGSAGPAVAVVYGVGAIQPGSGRRGFFGDSQISAQDFIADLRAARENPAVKAVVIRVDSPGGSMAASDAIWREIRRTIEQGKPVIASMGNAAASGGYYMAMACDAIVAQPTTITGSIGVVSMRINLAGLYEDFDINVEVIKTSPNADFFDDHRELSEAEVEAFLDRTKDAYQIFITKAAEGRGMTVEAMDKVARGRVWMGADALDAGLIDHLGGLDRAVALAAEKAGLSKHRVIRYPLMDRYFGMFSDGPLPLAETTPVFSKVLPEELKLPFEFAQRNPDAPLHLLAVSPYQLTID